MTPDVNVLIAALREDHPHHVTALAWLQKATADAAVGIAALTLMPMVVARVLRLVTSPKVFGVATPVDAVLSFFDALLGAPGVRIARLGDEWPTLRRLCSAKRLAGNDIPDAWLAAATLALDEHLVSFDRDFKKLLSRAHFTLLT